MRFTPADESERLRNRVDLVVVADTRKSEQLEHEFAQPCRVMREVNKTGVEMRSLGRQPHDLVTLELVVVPVSPNSFILQRLDQAPNVVIATISFCPACYLMPRKIGGSPGGCGAI